LWPKPVEVASLTSSSPSCFLLSFQATSVAVAASTGNFVEQAYADFQISSGVAGTAQAEANAVFVGSSFYLLPLLDASFFADLSLFRFRTEPFGSDLSAISAADLQSVKTMREAAEAAEASSFLLASRGNEDRSLTSLASFFSTRLTSTPLSLLPFVDTFNLSAFFGSRTDSSLLPLRTKQGSKTAAGIALQVGKVCFDLVPPLVSSI